MSLYSLRHLIPSSIYSIRLFIIFICLIDNFIIPYEECAGSLCLVKKLFVFFLALVSYLGTRKPARIWDLPV
jgi:hypothetical protein